MCMYVNKNNFPRTKFTPNLNLPQYWNPNNSKHVKLAKIKHVLTFGSFPALIRRCDSETVIS